MIIPLLDIQRELKTIREEIDKAIDGVVNSCQFILGPVVKEFENLIADYCGVKYAIGVASGTDALIIALRALNVGPGDEVITTSYSFFATASSIWQVGAKPVFVDINPETFNINPELIAEKITNKTKAILVVHLFGQICDMTRIKEVVKDIPIIEDAAQAIGSTWEGIRAGNLGKVGCFSFFPSKNLGGFGDGGMIVTSDSEVASKCSSLRVHGASQTYIHDEVGYNSRLDSIQAAVLKAKFPYLEQWSQKRRENAALYNKLFEKFEEIVVPFCDSRSVPIYNQYVIRVPNRDELKKKLKESQIGHSVYYPLPLPLQPCFADLGYRKGDFPEAERASKETIALPIFPYLKKEEIRFIAEKVIEHVS